MTYSASRITFGPIPPSSVSVIPIDSHVDEPEKPVADTEAGVSGVAKSKILKRSLTAAPIEAARVTTQKKDSLHTPAIPHPSRSAGPRHKQISRSLSRSVSHVTGKVSIPNAFHFTVPALSLSPRGSNVPSIAVNGGDLQTSSEPIIELSRGRSTTTGSEKSPEAAPLSSPRLGDNLGLVQRLRGNSGGQAELPKRSFSESSPVVAVESPSGKKLSRRSKSDRDLHFEVAEEKKGEWIAQVKRSVRFAGVKDASYQSSFDLFDQIKQRHDQDHIQRRMPSKGGTVFNPLYKHPLLLTFEEISSRLSPLSLIEPEKTAQKLSLCIQRFPEKHPVILNDWIEFRNTLTGEKNIHQFNRIIALILIKPENHSFIYSYSKKPEIDLEEFASMTLEEIIREESLSPSILSMMERMTQHDLQAHVKTGVAGTLFRGPWLSSSLCGKFGSLVWKKELDSLGHDILKELNEKKASTLCLNGNPGNTERFESFVRSVLTRIFSMPVPVELQQMLTMRRALIADFLKEHSLKENEDLKDLSRPYISEIFFLRLLSPFIIYLEKEDCEERRVLVSLSKVLQRLANAIAFEAKEPLYVPFNPLLSLFQEKCNTFTDRHSWKE